MSTGYSWEGIRKVRATLLGARHVPERLCGGRVYLGRYIKCSTFHKRDRTKYGRLTGQQIFNIALLPGKILVNMIDPFNVHTNIISDLLDHVGILRNMN